MKKQKILNEIDFYSARIEKAVYLSVVLLFSTFIIAQAMIFFGAEINILSIGASGGVSSLGTVIDATKSGEIWLAIEKSGSNPHIKILENGRIVGDFREGETVISVRANSLIEIDARKENEGFFVRIFDQSGGIYAEKMGVDVYVKKNIAILGKIL